MSPSGEEEEVSWSNNDKAYVALCRIGQVCYHGMSCGTMRFEADDRRSFKEICRFILANRMPPGYEKVFRDILQDGGNVNYQIPVDSSAKLEKSSIVGYTALHFAVKNRNCKALNLLLELGADPMIQGRNGFTALRLGIEKNYGMHEKSFDLIGTIEHPLVELLLDAQVRSGNAQNPSCKDGVSHLHIACMLNHTDAVKLFLENGVFIDKRVSFESKYLAGYTPLQLAARYCSVDAIQVLLEYGAGRHPSDVKGMTPLCLLLDYKMQLTKDLDQMLLKNYHWLQADFEKVNLALQLLFLTTNNISCRSVSLDGTGLTYLHLLCTDMNQDIKEDSLRNVRDLNVAIFSESPFCPGYTPLHFAAHFNRYTFLVLLKHGANISAADVKGVTPIDIFMRRYGTDVLHNFLVLSSDSLPNVRFTNGDRLTDVIASDAAFLQYLDVAVDKNISISSDSPIWPGCNLLHVAVYLAEFPPDKKTILDRVGHVESSLNSDFLQLLMNFRNMGKDYDVKVAACLLRGVDFSAQDSSGSTPLHLAFRQRKDTIVREIVKLLTPSSTDTADRNGLSHLHIMVCSKREDFADYSTAFVSAHVDRQLECEHHILQFVNYNDCYKHFLTGSTALHMAVTVRSHALVRILLKNGADPNIQNSEGLSPTHLAVLTSYTVYELMSHPQFLSENTTSAGGFSNLHAACCTSSSQAIENFINLGADVNLAITGQYSDYSEFPTIILNIGYTPLHLAVKHSNVEAIELLINNGANITAKDKSGLTPVHLAMVSYQERDILRHFFRLLQDKNLDYTDPETGITLLHMACAMVDKEAVAQLIGSRGANVNAQINSGSPIYPGCTPLHLLMNAREDETDERKIAIIEILLQNGADVTVADVYHKTPVHLSVNDNYSPDTVDILQILLEHQRSRKLNPVNAEGMSHFHLACIASKPKIVEAFLQNGIDANLATKCFESYAPRYTALHYVMCSSKDLSSTIKILVKYGADVNVRDAVGSAPLHVGISLSSNENLTALLKTGKVDVNMPNFVGERPLELLFNNASDFDEKFLKSLSLCLANGGLINVYNPVTSVGLLATLIENFRDSSVVFKVILEEAQDADSIDPATGRNTIHNVVSAESWDMPKSIKYMRIIGELVEPGVELELQDKQGRTPLHVAAKFGNPHGVEALLHLGADVNIVDDEGKTAFELNEDFSEDANPYVRQMLDSHVRKLFILGFEVNTKNRSLLDQVKSSSQSPGQLLDPHSDEKLRSIHVVEGDLTLRDFLTETALGEYPTMPTPKRQAIDEFVREKRGLYTGNEFGYLVNLQVRRAKKRLGMMEPAMRAIDYIAGLHVPVLCAENLLGHLSNSDFETLIKLLAPLPDVK